jgi:hypothetical protein
MELNWDDLMRGAERLEQMEQLEAVVIEIEADGVRWRVFGDGNQEIICLPGFPKQFPLLLMMTETLLNDQFGVTDKQLCCFRSN